jgi:hypothetical protein
MSVTTEQLAAIGVPLLPMGVSHYSTSGFADSWEAYDALIEADGWEEKDGPWKIKALLVGRVCVFSPHGERPGASAEREA